MFKLTSTDSKINTKSHKRTSKNLTEPIKTSTTSNFFTPRPKMFKLTSTDSKINTKSPQKTSKNLTDKIKSSLSLINVNHINFNVVIITK